MNNTPAPKSRTSASFVGWWILGGAWIAFGLACAEFFLPLSLTDPIVCYIIAGLGAVTALIVGVGCWRSHGKCTVFGAVGLLVLWVALYVVAYIALSRLRLF